MGDDEVRQAQQNQVKKAQKQVAKPDVAVAKAPVDEKEDKQKTESREEKKKESLKERMQKVVGKKKKEDENPVSYEREYIVPLRKEFRKVPEYKRANKAVKALKEFIVQHMKVYDRDLRKVKIDILLNNEIRFRGMRKPPTRIKVKAIKYESGIVEVKLVNIPKHIEFQLAREAKKKAESMKKSDSKAKEKSMQEAIAKAKAEKEKAEAEKAGAGSSKDDKAKERIKSAEVKTGHKTSGAVKHVTPKQAKVTQRKALKK